MRTRTKRIWAIVAILGIGVAVLIAARSYIFDRLKETLHEKVRSLNKTDLNIRYDSIYIDWRRNLILVDKLVVEKDAYDTTCAYPEFISVEKVRIEGFSLLSYLFRKKLSFESVSLMRPHIVVRQASRLLQDSSRGKENGFRLAIDAVHLYGAHVEYTDSAACKPLTDFKSTLHALALAVDAQAGKPPKFSLQAIQLDSTTVELPDEFYTLRVKALAADLKKGTLRLDTLKVTPHHPKLAFGRKKGFETDRLEGVVPFLNLSGLKLRYVDTFAIEAKSAGVQTFMKIFRDKRLPDKKRVTVLPLQLLRKLPFGLSIDSLRIIKSYVSYEEFQVEAGVPITVFFDDITATILHLNNDRSMVQGETILKAKAAFMGKGSVELVTVVPWQAEKNCTVEGNLKNFNLENINPLLEPLANMKVESGIMKRLHFKYAYNSTRADGEVALNYENLKLISYKDDEKLEKDKKRKRNRNKDPEDLKKDNLKSFIINAFVIRKNMDESVPEEKRTGTILFYRDTSKSLLNYWWKSVYSGIKSAYNLDKLEVLAKKKKK